MIMDCLANMFVFKITVVLLVEMLMATWINIIMAEELPNVWFLTSEIYMQMIWILLEDIWPFPACYRANENGQDMTDQIGGAYKDALAEAGPWGMYMYMQGETVPKETNYVALSKDEKR